MTVMTKPAQRLRRRRRVRAKIRGTAERPRISVFRSNRGIFAQLVDDENGRTIASVNWTEADLRGLRRMEQASAPARCSRTAPRRPASTPRCSTAAATSTTGAFKALADGAREGGLAF